MMKAKLITSVLLMAATLTSSAAVREDSLAVRTVEHGSMLLSLRSSVFTNPAMQSIHFRSSLNTLSATYSHTNASSPVRLEQGDGHNMGFGHIDAYLRKGKATLWGGADYGNGKTRDIQYNETSDFVIIAPYVIADTVGGSSQRETYHFMGGFSYPTGRFNIGAEGEYTALMEYRTRDPRPKNLTGHLKVKVGASYYVSSRNLIGIALSAHKYKQTNEVEIYNEVSMPVMYHLTGLGTDYYRFRGDYTETYYKGWTWGGMASFASSDSQGVFAHAAYERTSIDKIISSLNQLPMSTTVTHSIKATAGYSHNEGNSGYGFSIFGDHTQRNGTENIFGTAQDNIYPQIAEAKQYRLTTWNMGLQAVWQQTFSRNGYAVGMKTAYSDYDEHYIEPYRSMKAAAVKAAFSLSGHVQTGRILLTGRATADYEWATSHSLTLPDDASASKMLTPVTHYYRYLSENRWNATATAEAAYDTGKHFMPFISLDWQYAHYALNAHSTGIEVTAGVRF